MTPLEALQHLNRLIEPYDYYLTWINRDEDGTPYLCVSHESNHTTFIEYADGVYTCQETDGFFDTSTYETDCVDTILDRLSAQSLLDE